VFGFCLLALLGLVDILIMHVGKIETTPYQACQHYSSSIACLGKSFKTLMFDCLMDNDNHLKKLGGV